MGTAFAFANGKMSDQAPRGARLHLRSFAQGLFDMKLIGVRSTLLAAGVLIAASCISCKHSSPSGTVAKKGKPSPEESFALIYETFCRRMEEAPVGFVVSGSTGSTTMTGTNKVSKELIPPTNDTEPYKAIITVASQTQYTLQRAPDASDDSPHEKSGTQKKSDVPAESDDKNALAFDSSSEITKSHSPLHATAEAVTRRELKGDTKYELIYENGRWKLVTKLNPETEQSVQFAFNSALDTQ
jgi:hypothetical protein